MHFRASKNNPPPDWIVYVEDAWLCVRVTKFTKHWVSYERLDGVHKRISRQDWCDKPKTPFVLEAGKTATWVPDFDKKGKHDMERWPA